MERNTDSCCGSDWVGTYWAERLKVGVRVGYVRVVSFKTLLL